MRFTNFVNGCFGKVFTAILCIILGIVIAYGGVALAGYIAITKKGMVGTIEDFAQEKDLPIDFEEDMRDDTLLEWGKDVFEAVAAINTTQIGELERVIGYSDLSKMLADATGLSEAVIKESTIANIGQTLAENLSIGTLVDKFGIELPDMPIFSDDEFLGKPISTAFSSIDDFELQDFVEVPADASPILQSLKDLKVGEMSDEENGLDVRINALKLNEVIEIDENDSNAVLIKLQDVAVGELGSSATNDLIMTMKLNEIIDIDEETSTPVLWELRETEIGQLGSSETDDKIKNMKIADMLDVDSNSSEILQYFEREETTIAGTDETTGEPNGIDSAIKVMTLGDMMEINDPSQPGGSTKFLWALKDCPINTIAADPQSGTPEILGIEDQLRITPLADLVETGNSHVWNYLGTSTIDNIGTKIDDMKVADAILIDESSPAILKKMRDQDMKISQLGTELNPLIQSMELGEIIPIDENSEPILKALQSTTISGLNGKIATLKVSDVFSDCNVGILGLIDCDNTLLTTVPTALASAVTNARMQQLINVGIVNGSNFSTLSLETETAMRNNTIDGMISDYIAIINAISGTPPTIPSIPMPERISFNGNTISMNVLENLAGFDDGDTLVLTQDTTVALEDFSIIFNVILDQYTLTITDGATIRSINGTSGKDQGGFMFISNYDFGTYVGGGEVVGTFINPDDIADNAIIHIEEDI